MYLHCATKQRHADKNRRVYPRVCYRFTFNSKMWLDFSHPEKPGYNEIKSSPFLSLFVWVVVFFSSFYSLSVSVSVSVSVSLVRARVSVYAKSRKNVFSLLYNIKALAEWWWEKQKCPLFVFWLVLLFSIFAFLRRNSRKVENSK